MREDIKKILDLAVLAPSGENSQPWRFQVQENEIKAFNIPERDSGLYNFRQRGSYVAHGALLQNILIAAPVFGYEVKFELFPDSSDPNLVVSIHLVRSARQKEGLYEFIPRRTTNRKRYREAKLTAAEREALTAASPSIGGGDVRLVEDSERRRCLARAISVTERIIFEHRPLHAYLFDSIRWTQEEERSRGTGLSLDSLELPPPVIFGFKTVFRKWQIVQALNKLGFSKMVAADNAKTYASSSAIGAIVLPDDSNKDFVCCGRILQRMWLEATRLGLSVQPITTLAYLRQRIAAGDTGGLSSLHVYMVNSAYNEIAGAFGVNKEIIGMVFRIGHSAPPSSKSVRLPVDVKFILNEH